MGIVTPLKQPHSAVTNKIKPGGSMKDCGRRVNFVCGCVVVPWRSVKRRSAFF